MGLDEPPRPDGQRVERLDQRTEGVRDDLVGRTPRAVSPDQPTAVTPEQPTNRPTDQPTNLLARQKSSLCSLKVCLPRGRRNDYAYPGCDNEDPSGPTGCGPISRRRDCHFADAPFPSLLKHILEGEGRCSRMTEVSPTARHDHLRGRGPASRSARAGARHTAVLRPRVLPPPSIETSTHRHLTSDLIAPSRCRHSAAPPSSFVRCFNRDGKGMSAK